MWGTIPYQTLAGAGGCSLIGISTNRNDPAKLCVLDLCTMEENVDSIDECVSWLNKQVLDLLSLRGVITRLSTNWEQLKFSLREKGIISEDNESEQHPDSSGQGDPDAAGGKDKDLEGAGDSGGGSENTRFDPDGQEPRDDHPSEGRQSESVDGQTAVGFIGPVIPNVTTESAGGCEGVQSAAQCDVTEERTESVVDQNQNGSMETLELASAQSSGLQTDCMTEMQFKVCVEFTAKISHTCMLTDVVSMEIGSTSLGEEYQKIECAVLYWHKTSGYIYDPV